MDLEITTMTSFLQIATFKVKPAINNSTLEASFSPDGNHVISGYKIGRAHV